MFSSPQENHKRKQWAGDLWAPELRPRSHSLSSADIHRLHRRTVKFLLSDSDEEENGGSSAEGVPHRVSSRERPRGAAPKQPVSRVRDVHLGYPSHGGKLESSQTPPDCRQALRALEQHRWQQASPRSQEPKTSKKRQRSLSSVSRKFSQNPPPAALSRPQQQRPSSAGPAVKNRRKKVPYLPA